MQTQKNKNGHKKGKSKTIVRSKSGIRVAIPGARGGECRQPRGCQPPGLPAPGNQYSFHIWGLRGLLGVPRGLSEGLAGGYTPRERSARARSRPLPPPLSCLAPVLSAVARVACALCVNLLLLLLQL